MNQHKPFIVALAGGSGSGKTTLARILSTSMPWPVSTLPFDLFYKDLTHLSMEDRAVFNFDEPTSLDADDAIRALRDLKQGKRTRVPRYDFSQYNRLPNADVLSPAPVVLFEGMHALHHLELLELFDLTIFLNVDEQTRWQRKLDRDVRERGRTYHEVLRMWETFTKPMHDVYVQPTLSHAHFIFEDSLAPQVIDAITKLIRQKVHLLNNDSNYFPE